MTYTLFLIPLLIMVVGFLMFKFPPKKINWIIGYRTKSSMKNEQKWNKANKYCSKVWIKLGLLMSIISIILVSFTLFNLLTITENIITIIIILQVSTIVMSIYLIEKKIKDN